MTRKRFIPLVLGLIFSISPVFPQFNTIQAAGVTDPSQTSFKTLASPDNSIVAYYEFEEVLSDGVVKDLSGNGRDAILMDGAILSQGKDGKAVELNGASDSYVKLPEEVVLGDDFSFSGWVNWNGGGGAQRIFDFGEAIAGQQDIYFTTKIKAAPNTPRLQIKGGGPAINIDGSKLFPTGTWTHLAVVYSGKTIKYYIDGVLAASNDKLNATPLQTKGTVNELGKSKYPLDPNFVGKMDSIAIYSKALSESEVLELAGGPTWAQKELSLQSIDSEKGTAQLKWEPALMGDNPIARYDIFANNQVVANVNGDSVGTVTYEVQGLSSLANTSYVFELQAIDSEGHKTARPGPIAYHDVTPPSSGPALSANTGAAADTVMLVWGPAVDNFKIANYEVFKNGESIATVGGEVYTYTVSEIQFDTEYEFKVEAIDMGGNRKSGPAQIYIKHKPFTLADIPDNTLKIGDDFYQMDSDRILEPKPLEAIRSLLKEGGNKNKIYFKIGGHWYNPYRLTDSQYQNLELIPAYEVPENDIIGFGKWYKTGDEVVDLTNN